MGLLDSAKVQAKRLKRETYALYFVARDPRTPWYARLLCAAVVAYALSPFDLIPDFVPVLGYLDDLVIVPLGIALALRLVPREVLEDSRARAHVAADKPVSRAGAAFVIAVWLLLALLAIWLVRGVLA
ncbi:MAG TPA: YkvA family protein [Chloroflexota bacterium]